MDIKKYKVISSIETDAQFGSINWCTISFLTPENNPESKFLEVKGFKVHNGYNTAEQASFDSDKIRLRNKNHDVYMSELGKLYPWDDATKTDSIEYNNDKLNDMEVTRKESIDKLKLIREQFVNESQNSRSGNNSQKAVAIKERMRQKLLSKGLISKIEYDSINEAKKEPKLNKKSKLKMEEMKVNLANCIQSNVDYLDENPPIGLKFGCMTLYSPKWIHGLKSLCFKIRGLFQTEAQLHKRVSKLKILYPDDKIYIFEVGKWTPISENTKLEYQTLNDQLNFAMKCHLDSLDRQEEEFEKRKDKMEKGIEQQNKLTKRSNRIKEREDKLAKSQGKQLLLGTQEDEEAIANLIEYLFDPELDGKYSVDKSKLTTVEVNAG